MYSTQSNLRNYLKFLVVYHSRKTRKVGVHIENFKDKSVTLLMHRRGRFQKYIWHTSMIGLAAAGVLTSGVMGGTSIVASSFPGSGGQQDPRFIETFDPQASGISLDSLINMKTTVSEKPRSEI